MRPRTAAASPAFRCDVDLDVAAMDLSLTVLVPNSTITPDRYHTVPSWRSHAAATHLPDTPGSRLCRVAAVLRRVRPAEAHVDGPGRGAPCHRDGAQLP